MTETSDVVVIDRPITSFPSGNWDEGSALSGQDLCRKLNAWKVNPNSIRGFYNPEDIKLLLLCDWNRTTSVMPYRPLLISDLGWTIEEAIETRARLKSFEEDWDSPGMEAYDKL